MAPSQAVPMTNLKLRVPVACLVLLLPLALTNLSPRTSLRPFAVEDLKEPSHEEALPVDRLGSSVSPRNQTGSWQAGWWVPPPGWKLYSAEEARDYYADRSVMWFGDSTARRASMTMYNLLEQAYGNQTILARTLDSNIDINKKATTEPCLKWPNATVSVNYCRSMPGSNSTGEFMQANGACMGDVMDMFQSELDGESNVTAGIDTIIIAIGIWEVMRPQDCRGNSNLTLNEKEDAVIDLMDRYLHENPDTRIVWRLGGYFGAQETDGYNLKIRIMNDRMLNKFDAYMARMDHGRFSYVDWAGAVRERSFEHRIVGDMKPHYGLEPRLVSIHMITNVLQEMENSSV